MANTRKMTRRGRTILTALILVAVLAVTAVIGFVSAKYMEQSVLPGKISISATLAQSIEIYEHEAERTEHGDYVTTADTTDGNVYKIMPGVDIPKDPTVKVTGYTGLDAWLYVEVTEDGVPATVTYTVDSDIWQPLKDENGAQVTGPNNGKIYYKELTEDDAGDVVLQILKADTNGNTITVSQDVARDTDLKLGFYAFITQKISADPAADFTQSFADNG